MPDLRVRVEDLELSAEWTGDNPETRAAIKAELPIEGHATRWGDELYFRTPVDVREEDGQETVPEGAIAYWPQGNAVCLFWGTTPASTGEEPRAASAVNLVAMLSDPERLNGVEGGAEVRIESV
jgi:hypothetical protein